VIVSGNGSRMLCSPERRHSSAAMAMILISVTSRQEAYRDIQFPVQRRSVLSGYEAYGDIQFCAIANSPEQVTRQMQRIP
jgi:hypothetical protein